jgi:hypothetical protein
MYREALTGHGGRYANLQSCVLYGPLTLETLEFAFFGEEILKTRGSTHQSYLGRGAAAFLKRILSPPDNPDTMDEAP